MTTPLRSVAAPTEEDLAHLVAMSSLDGLGPSRLSAVLEGRSPAEAWEVLRTASTRPGDPLGCCRGVNSGRLVRWAEEARRIDPVALLARHRELGVDVMTATDPDWPPTLLGDPEPPLLLFGRGPVKIGADPVRPSVAVVGTRRCTSYGRSLAGELGEALARAGVTVVSGLASGIDATAQRAALDAGGRVVGVVGSGLDRVYPSSSRTLWRDLSERGRLFSECPLGLSPAPWRFPARNRIVAALADVVVVVESAERGGSLYTVDAAVERDRPVMAVPGPIRSPASRGTNRLIADGCAPVCDVGDVLTAVGMISEGSAGSPRPSRVDPGPGLSGAPALVLDALGWESQTLSGLCLATGLEPAGVTTALFHLEARGTVHCQGGWWQRVR